MKQTFTELRELIRGFAAAMNLISPEVQNHHQQVAYLACRLARQLQMPESMQQHVLYAGLLHDVGSIILGPDSSRIEPQKNPFALAKKSAEILSRTNLLRPVANLRDIMDAGFIIRTADYISLHLRPDIPVLNQVKTLSESLRENEHFFSSRVIDAFLEISQIESVWLDLVIRHVAGVEPGERDIMFHPLHTDLQYFAVRRLLVRGHEIEVFYQRTAGAPYAGLPAGYTVFADGRRVYQGDGREAAVLIPCTEPERRR